MLKKLLCGAALVSCALSAQAEVRVFNYSYTNFYYNYSETNNTFTGQFSVEDKNGDGVYGMSELLTFDFNREGYLPCSGGSYFVDVTCSIRRFSYQPGGQLDFSMEKSIRSDSGDSGFSVTSGAYFAYTYWPPVGGPPATGVYQWTDYTYLSIAAVPEPQTWMMFSAGLLALAGAARRRRGLAAGIAG
jgi:hypothetical protein